MLKNKVAIVIGSSRGLGKNICTHLAKKGVRLCITSRILKNLNETEELLQKLNADFFSQQLDVKDYENCEKVIQQTIEKYGKIDFLINTSSSKTKNWDLTKMNPMEIKEDINTTYRGAVFTTKAVMPHFMGNRNGTIIHVSSIGGLMNYPSRSSGIYAASKSAVIRFCQRMNDELSKHHIRVCCLVPCSMKEEKMPNSITYEDAAKTISFMCEKQDNLSLQTVYLKPQLSEI